MGVVTLPKHRIEEAMPFDIIHLADLHFGNPEAHLKRSDVATALETLLTKRADTTYLVISGDITIRGRKEGYREATEALQTALARVKFPAKHVIVCPGNHDLIAETAGRPLFQTFDEWSTGLRGDKECTFAQCPVRIMKAGAADFILINTAHHGRSDFGQVDIGELGRVISAMPLLPAIPDRPLIAVLHHHFVPVLINDTSTIRNAYEVLELLQQSGCTLVLHGHQHAILSLSMGEQRMQISGVGSFGFNSPGVINSCAVYTMEGMQIKATRRFGITLDLTDRIVEVHSTRGKW